MGPYRLIHRGPAWRESFAIPLADPEKLIAIPGAHVLKRNPRSTVALVTLDGSDLAVKIFNESRLDRRLLRWFAGSAARRVGRSINHLQRAGFGVPLLVAVLDRRDGLIHSGSCVVTRAVGAGTKADEIWHRLDRAQRRQFAHALGQYVRRLHESGFYPQDLRVDNLLITLADEGWTFVLVDLDRVREYETLGWRRRMKNLVQIDRSLGRSARRPGHLRFLLTYLEAASRDEVRRVAGRVLVESRRKDAEYARRRAKAARAQAATAPARGKPRAAVLDRQKHLTAETRRRGAYKDFFRR